MNDLSVFVIASIFEDQDDEFCHKVMPYIEGKYFQDEAEKFIFETAKHYYLDQNKIPTPEVIFLELDNSNLPQNVVNSAQKSLKNLPKYEKVTLDWKLAKTEEFCKKEAQYLAAQEAIDILEGNSKKKPEMIPGIFENALSIDFNPQIGRDLVSTIDSRFDYYTKPDSKILFREERFNDATYGGITLGSLNMVYGDTGTGKTLTLCSLASDYLRNGEDVLYVTLEISEFEILKRIDANTLGIPLDQFTSNLTKETFLKKIQMFDARFKPGKLMVKQYAPGQCSAFTLKNLLRELRLKKGFVPKIVFVDYINLMASSRHSVANSNSYAYVKAIAEELRGLGVNHELAVWSASQLNREGHKNENPDMSLSSDSYGVPMTADLVWIAVRTPDLNAKGKIMFKQDKSRYCDIAVHMPKFIMDLSTINQRLTTPKKIE